MVRVEPECYPCFLDQVLKACVLGGADPRTTAACLRKASAMISRVSEDDVPARAASALHEMIREIAGLDDPFNELKERAIDRFQELYELARGRVDSSSERLKVALELSGVGNMFDYGIVTEEEAEEFLNNFESAAGNGFDYEGFVSTLEKAVSVGMLLDNTGEVPFDLVLAEILRDMGKEVWLGVKGGPVIDDLTIEEARRLGLTDRFEVISNGSRGVGTLLEESSEEFRRKISESDLVLSKGQANFETLWGHLPNCAFLFVVKCPVIERITGFPRGTVLLKGSWSAREGEGDRGQAIRGIF